jgi:hypothetical protein
LWTLSLHIEWNLSILTNALAEGSGLSMCMVSPV